MKWTTKQFAMLTGVSTRTLHYYDEIGLLKPAFTDEQNGYRSYDGESFGRMKQILFYRGFDFSLEDIREILSASEQDARAALAGQKAKLVSKKERLERLITLAESIEKGENMEKMIDSFVKDSVTLDPRTVTFYELLEEADRILENDTVHEMLVLVKTTKGSIYHMFQDAATGYDPMKDIEFMDMLAEQDDAQVKYLVVLWNPKAETVQLLHPDIPYALEVPGWSLRRGLLELAPGNEDTLLILRGQNAYHVRALKDIQPPQEGLAAEWKRLCALRGMDG